MTYKLHINDVIAAEKLSIVQVGRLLGQAVCTQHGNAWDGVGCVRRCWVCATVAMRMAGGTSPTCELVAIKVLLSVSVKVLLI